MIRKMEMNKRLFLFLFYLCISVYGFSADRVEGIRGGVGACTSVYVRSS